ncbi:MAG: endolytic transglycosylase MltG [Gammaproteobacteria bacterium]|nr:MAG: endolytic transglycosylase MltG [Gammaproteobacteria bacterium]
MSFRLRLLFFLLLVAVAGLLGWGWAELNRPVTLEAPVVLEVQPGSTLTAVARQLQEIGLVRHPGIWRAYARVKGLDRTLKAGEYELDGTVTPLSVLALLNSGRTRQYSVTILEGWTYRQMLEHLWAQPRLKRTLDAQQASGIMQRLGMPEMNPEGWFLPETYFYSSGMTDFDILRRSHEAMRRLLEQEWETRGDNLPLKTPYEALILASIVEKETGAADERPMIAAVFINRLRKGMRLQTDPTVIYGMGDRYRGNIRKSDLRRDTPYNTYTRKGLPPTPIALPSASSIHAVLHPANTSALYFVASGGGRHHFSKTYEEHRKAVIKYLLGGNAARYKGDQP